MLMPMFQEKLEELIKNVNEEKESDTPDFILSEYLIDCLEAFNKAVNSRSTWYRTPSVTAADGTSRRTASVSIRPRRHYNPQEQEPRYPLELTPDLHICLWAEDAMTKWTIALWRRDSEGYDLHFIGDRPFDPRVNWEHFRELIVQGQRIADKRFSAEEER